ncbi:MAG: macro domain-containing protein [Anaerolineae bacterium]|nr:macro domain-containing protein [Anaerolineae bacterium]
MSVAKSRYTLPTSQVLEIVQGDLTEETVDAIVNAANAQLAHGGGVAAAIVRRGGYQIQQESNDWVRKHGPVSHDKPAYTGAGALPCRYIIHAVGPVWGEGNEDQKLASAVSGSLRVADELKLSSIAMPAISTGIFGFPKERAAKIFFETIYQYFQNQPASGLKLVRITIIDTPTIEIFAQAAAQWQQKNTQVKCG